MKIALISDTHLGIRNNNGAFLHHQAKFFNEVFFPYLKENGIKKIIHLGDYFDNRKSINIKALEANKSFFIQNMWDNDITMDIILGNHDIYYNNTSKLNSVQSLLGRYTGGLINIYDEPTVKNYDGLDVALVPWINQDNEEKSLKFLETTQSKIVMGHFDIIGFDLLPGIKATEGLTADVFNRFDMVLSGHYHNKSESETRKIRYLGSQFEFTWSDAHMGKFFHIMDTEDPLKLTAVVNPLKMFRTITYTSLIDNTTFDFESCKWKYVKVVVEDKSDLYKFDVFMEKINKAQALDVKVIDTTLEPLDDSNYDATVERIQNTTELINDYIDNNIPENTAVNRDSLKKLLSDLYVESGKMQ